MINYLPKNKNKISNCKSINKDEIIGPIKDNKLNKSIRDTLNQLRPSEKILYTDSKGKINYVLLCSRRLIISDKALNLLKGQMLESRLLKFAEGLNLELWDQKLKRAEKLIASAIYRFFICGLLRSNHLCN